MEINTILLLISAVIFVSYTQYIAFKYGIQKSISESYYRLKENKESLAIFTLALWGFAIPVIIVGGSMGSFWLFFAGALITLVGAAPGFKDLLMEYKAHMFGAYGGVLLGMVGIAFLGQIGLVLSFITGSIIIRLAIKNYIWWVEVAAFVTILLGLFLINT